MSAPNQRPDYPDKYYAQLLFFARGDEIYDLVERKIRRIETRARMP
jgi:hypothetical protein